MRSYNRLQESPADSEWTSTATARGGLPAQIQLIAGPTGSGKTEAATDLAERIGAPVVVADRIQCYVDLETTSARFTDTADRHHLDDRLVQDGDYPTEEAAARLLAHVRDLAAHYPVVVVEGGSISVLRHFARYHRRSPFPLHARVLDPGSDSDYFDRLRDRATRMIDAGLLDEFVTAWSHTAQRRFVASINGFEAIVQWCERTGTHPEDLLGVTNDDPVSAELADAVARAHAEHGHEQYAVFTSLFG
ncbi:isopentenyl transferase family protein [Nocardia sp. R6R-6]|uniref:isopentenyl transferase family protein n=1 Tax=Nocardia sp. R6R-6 TaxID=3459303 RepID=UPI00403E3522